MEATSDVAGLVVGSGRVAGMDKRHNNWDDINPFRNGL